MIDGAPGERRPRSRRLFSGTPILLYHGLSRAGEPDPVGDAVFWVFESAFRSQLAEIRANGYETLWLEEFLDGVPARRDHQVLLTFDDGNRSDYELAFPALAEAGMRGIFFVNSSTVGDASRLSWAQAREMQQAGMSIQSHGHEHRDYRQLTAAELERQLAGSKRILEDRLGREVLFFAAPHGLLSDLVVRKALEAGYRAVCSTRSLPAHADAKVLCRVCIYRETTPREFRQLLTGSPAVYGKRTLRWVLYSPVRVARKYPWARRIRRAVRRK